MEVLKFLIVEDDFYIARDLQKGIESIGYEVTAIASSSIDAIRAFNETKPDFVIMDIELPESRDAGIQLAKNFKSRDEDLIIIYHTSHIEENDLMQEAIKTSSDAIFSKKSNLKELKVNIANIIRRRTFLLEDDMEIRKDANSFWIKDEYVYRKIRFEDICWIQAKNKKAYIYTDTDKVIFSSTLNYIKGKIAKRFLVKTSQSYLININKAFDFNKKYRTIKVQREKGGAVEIPISDHYFDELMSCFNILTTR
jgi:DNA-binding LytR/AlgR family response regulator